ncbi:hypothetical protein BS47DRAFT_1368141 [Hydnum rufescens UP504]|uniref:Uncharacterized protein n=1 Tax=Hydnum rufescens UP504 TaxID=1448309 RepID=A0A9P6AGA2_9AGAM|nr:hypothetical protein BS47DRAFT_1368141 [Hydnum rufescens UP504]
MQLTTPDQRTEGNGPDHTPTAASVWSSRSCSSLNEYMPENPPAPLSPVRKTDGGGCTTAGQNEYHTPTKAGSELTREMENQAQTTWQPRYKMSTTHPLKWDPN